MNGLISSYELSGDLGKRIAGIKGYNKAWNCPTFLPKLISNPGALVYYEKILIDQISYEKLYDNLVVEVRTKVRDYVESQRLNIFESINIQEPLHDDKENLVERIEKDYTNLKKDAQFVSAVKKLKSIWGKYANPNPLSFECMNIPLIEILREKWSKKRGELSLIDDIERAVLYKIRDKKKLSDVFIPEVAEVLFRTVPKLPFLTPIEKGWNEDTILELREDKSIRNYKRKVKSLTRKASNNFEKALKENLDSFTKSYNFNLHSNNKKDEITELFTILDEIKNDVLDDLMKSFQSIFSKNIFDEYDALGIVIGIGGILVSLVPGLAEIGPPLAYTGFSLTPGNMIRKYLKRRSNKWIEFFYFSS